MGQEVSRTDFEWVYDDEPHATRRKEMLAKYPQIKKLFGYDPKFKYLSSAMVLIQFVMLFVIKNQSWPVTLLAAYCFGGIVNHSLMLGIHETLHNLAFGQTRPLSNRIFGFFLNLPIGIPATITFRKYHLEHHRYQGDDRLDTDLPTQMEGKLFHTTFGKLIWLFLNPAFYSLRPMFVNPKPIQFMELMNALVQLVFDVFVLHFFGFRVLFGYMIFGSIMAMGFHPVAGHFIAEHYMFAKGHETYSYYGPFNWITFNAGYHMEHHDFPSIPGGRLPEVRKIAPEYYDNLPYHTSWPKVLYDFITDPAIGPYTRIRRKTKRLISTESQKIE